MHLRPAPTSSLSLAVAFAAGILAAAPGTAARADSLLLIETDTGRILHADNAGHPWYPASITKIMTTYVTLRAVREGRITLDTLLTVSANALSQQPSKMGFPVGTQITVDNALKMLMVKSANDIAVVIAEGVSGSVEAFAGEMNRASQRLSMTQSRWVNPNGLPAENQVTSARDMAILARALIREFPQHSIYWRAPAIRLGRRVIRNYNKLLDRYPGADGMKTGFICASGYNLVATASRSGRRLIAVVLGAPSGKKRNEMAAQLLERGFGGGALSWLMPSLGSVDSLRPVAAAPPNLRDDICGKGRRNRTDHADEEYAQADQPGAQGANGANLISAFASAFNPGFQASSVAGQQQGSLLGPANESMPPIPVTIIPPKGVSAANPEALMSGGRRKRGRVTVSGKGKGRKSAVIDVGKPAAKTKPAAAKPKGGAKPAPKKPAKNAGVKPKSAAVGAKQR